MKTSKTKLLISSILSLFGVSLLVGSTFASWAVSDNADHFSIDISLGGMPVKEGYYLTFASDDYSSSATSAIIMSSDENNKALVNNVPISNGDKVKIYYFDGLTYEKDKVDLNYTFGDVHGFASLSGSEITFNTSRSGNIYSFYLNNNNELFIDDEIYKEYDGYYVTYSDDDYAFKSYNKMTDTPSSGNIAEATLSIDENETFKIEKFEGRRGIIPPAHTQASDYPHFTSSVTGDSVITIKESATYRLMVSANDDKVYIANDSLASLNGFYITYAPNYDYRDGVKMNVGGGSNLAELSLDIPVNTTVKIINVDAVNDFVSGTKYLQGDSSKPYLSTLEDSETLTFTKADTYDFYVGNDNKVYTAIGSYNTIYLKTSNEWEETIENKKMLYFVNNNSWSQVAAYVYRDGASYNPSWPGSLMEYTGETNEYGQGIYQVEIDTSLYDYVIFNNNNNGSQTIDIRVSDYQDCTQLYLDGMVGGKYNVSYNTNYRPPRTGPHFYSWVWESGQAGRWVELIPSLTHSGYYEMTIHNYETNVIFARCAYRPTSDDGSELNTYKVWNQTSDLTITDSNNCYTITGWSGGSWSLLS